MKGSGKVNWDRLMPESGVVVILGYIRMGKSSLAHWLMERFHAKRGMGGAILHLPMLWYNARSRPRPALPVVADGRGRSRAATYCKGGSA